MSTSLKKSSSMLKDKQKAALLKMLALNIESLDGTEPETSGKWKVLVYDQYCRSIVSPILKLHELRMQHVTLHYLLDSSRDAMPDVPAIYFVQPTEHNIRRIAKDCQDELYSSIHLNFATSHTSREMIELLARLIGESKCSHMISRLYDQHVNFVTLEPNLFTLNHTDSYSAYNDVTLPDEQIESTIDRISDGLFSVLATMNEVPVIRCPNTDGPSRMVAEKLCTLLRDHLVGRSNLFNESFNSSGFQRPVLIVLDRNEDLASALHHPSTYQALVDDLLGLKLNRVKVKVANKGSEGHSQRVYDLDVSTDSFFERHSGDRFPDAIAANEAEMQEVTKKEEDLKSRAGGSSNPNASDGTKDLAAAVDTLPALLEQKKVLEIHTNIFQSAFEIVASRHVPVYSVLEQRLIDGSSVDKSEVVELLGDSEKGNLTDKIRLLMIYYLSTTVASEDMEEMEALLTKLAEERGENLDYLRAWRYLKRHQSFQKHASVGESFLGGNSTASSGIPTNPSMSMFKDLAGNLAGQAQGWINQAAQSVKNFLPENKKLHITRVTDVICELKPNTEDETYLYLDPKIKSSSREVPRQRTPFTKAIVFVIGGGNYNEYQNILAYSKIQEQRTVLYGCTELFNSESFLQELASLEK